MNIISIWLTTNKLLKIQEIIIYTINQLIMKILIIKEKPFRCIKNKNMIASKLTMKMN